MFGGEQSHRCAARRLATLALPKFTGAESPPLVGSYGKVNHIPMTSLVNLRLSGGIMSYEWNKSTGTMAQLILNYKNVYPASVWTAYDSSPFATDYVDVNPIESGGQSNDQTSYLYNMAGALVTGSVLYHLISTLIGFPSSQEENNSHNAADNAISTLYQVMRSVYM